MIEAGQKSIKRCAIYTRKSTEEGLDQVFNTLDAQREACEAYREVADGGGVAGPCAAL
jgi:DNA invertase Pin-like site-specific DNA recombinase